MSKIDQLVKTIISAIEERDKKKTHALDTSAIVSRVDGSTAWVKFAGSDMETPVKETISVKKGDKVQVRSSKGKAWIVGNETAPPTDDTLAKQALNKSEKAIGTADNAASMTIVEDVMWYLASALDEGVTVDTAGWTREAQEATASLPYLWCYHEYTRGNGSKFNSEPVIIGHYTEGGAGITAVQPQYYLSTSSTSCTGGSWGSSFTYLSGYYIWTREQITLSDSTVTYSTPIYSEALTTSCALSNDTAQYFWTKSSGGTTDIPTGSYVTMYPKSQYTNSGSANYCSGGSTLMRSDGLYLRYGAQTVAQFLAAGVTLLNSAGATLASFLSDGMRLYNSSGSEVAKFTTSGARMGTTSYYNAIIADGLMSFNNGSTNYGELRWAGYKHVGIYSGTGELILTPSALTSNVNTTISGKLTASAINESLFAVSSESVSTSSGTGNLTGTATATKAGYYPLAIAGLSVATGSCYSRGVYLTSQASGSCTVNFRAYNSGSSQAVSATAYVLWVKTTA